MWGFVGPVAVLLARWGFSGFVFCFSRFLWLVVLTGTVSISAPGRCRAARQAGQGNSSQEQRKEPELRLNQKRRRTIEHGPGVKLISPGCAARASFVITINTCTYKTKYKLFLPSKRLKTLLLYLLAIWHKLQVGTPLKLPSDTLFRYVGRSG